MKAVLALVITTLAITIAADPLVASWPGSAIAGKQFGTLLFPAWSPDGKQIAWADAPYANVPSPPGWQIWTAGADGSNAHIVIKGAVLGEGLAQLEWIRPNALAFWGNFSLYLAPISGKPKLLARDIGDTYSHDAAGTRFAFTASRCGRGLCPSRIIVHSETKGNDLVIGGPKARYVEPTLAPDGSRVAFVALTSPDGLVVAHVDGTHLRRIAPLASCPKWSPDGRNILYVGANSSLRVVSPTSGRSTILVATPVGCGVVPFNFGWSPDGRRIALINPRSKLSIIDLTTRKARTIRTFAQVGGFAWSPKSSQLLVVTRQIPSVCSSLWRIDTDGAHPRLIARC